MKKTNKIFGMITFIAGVMLVGAFALGLAGCDDGSGNGGGGFTQAEKDLIKTDALAEYNADPADFADTLEMIKAWYKIDLTGKPNPNTWSDSDWNKYYDACKKIEKDFGGNNNNNNSNNKNPFKDEYPNAAAFPALTGASDFIGTWKGNTMYTLTFADTGAWTTKWSMGATSSTVDSGRFLVSGNTVYIYMLETLDGSYYMNSWGTKSGNTIAMSGGMTNTVGESLTKESSSSGGSSGEGGSTTNNHAIVAKWYASQEYANTAGSPYTYEFTADSKLNTGNGILGMYSFSISGNTITFSVMGMTMATATFSISGNVLTVTNAGNDSPVPNGTYYKPAS